MWDGQGNSPPRPPPLKRETQECTLADDPLPLLRCSLLQFAKLVSNEMLESVNKVQDAIQLALAKAEKVRGTLLRLRWECKQMAYGLLEQVYRSEAVECCCQHC